MLDSDLAGLYGVTVKTLNEQVRRNFRRFPSDFMIRFTAEEHDGLRSQYATLKPGRGEHLACRLPRNCFSFVLSISEELNRLCRH